MVKPEVQVIRFDNSIVASVISCGVVCKYQCGSISPGCDGVCTLETCVEED